MKSLIINNLKKTYNQNIIFEKINLTLNSNIVYFLTDENGKGKTTFLKCLIKEIKYEGSIIDNNYKFIFMPERPLLAENITVITFIKLFLLYEGVEFNDNLINHYLMEFAILRFKDSLIRTLSRGTKQKVMIIKTLLVDSDVYLFDEPLTSLDSKSRKKFMEMINDLSKKDKIIVIATHYYDDYDFKNKERINL